MTTVESSSAAWNSPCWGFTTGRSHASQVNQGIEGWGFHVTPGTLPLKSQYSTPEQNRSDHVDPSASIAYEPVQQMVFISPMADQKWLPHSFFVMHPASSAQNWERGHNDRWIHVADMSQQRASLERIEQQL